MKFRNLVLLAAIASFASLVRYAVWIVANAKIAWQSHGNLFFNLLTSVVFVVFLCFLYGEASGWIQSQARAIAAIVLLILTVLSAAGETLHVAVGIYTLRHYDVPSRSELWAQVFGLLETFIWIAFLIAFSSKKVTATTRLIPSISGVLALFTFCSGVWSSVQMWKAFVADSHLPMASWDYVLLLFGRGTLILFYVEIWRRWKRDLTI